MPAYTAANVTPQSYLNGAVANKQAVTKNPQSMGLALSPNKTTEGLPIYTNEQGQGYTATQNPSGQFVYAPVGAGSIAPATPAPTTPATPAPAPTIGGVTQSQLDALTAQQLAGTLPANGVVTMQPQVVQDSEMLEGTAIDPYTLHVGSVNLGQAAQGTAATATAPAVATQTQAQNTEASVQGNVTAGQYDATQIDADGNSNTLTAAQGYFTEEELVQGQLAKLYDSMDIANPPPWARGAMRVATQRLAAMGMDNSSIGAAAIAQAVMEAALPIASADAQSLQGIKLNNINNQQQVNLAKFQSRTNIMLSNQAAENASKQFNATNQQQVQEFMVSLATQINQSNAERATQINQFNAQMATATSQFNAEQANQITQYFAGLQTDMSKFNAEQINAITQGQAALNADLMKTQATLTNQREQFNVSNALVIAQSNAQWRRQVNTQNTEAQNYANQVNALNSLSMSNTAYNNLWQAYRDEAAWAFESSENGKERATRAALYAMQLDQRNSEIAVKQRDALISGLGSFAGKVFGTLIDSAGDDDSSGDDSGDDWLDFGIDEEMDDEE